ncbi:Uncharacterised protein [Dermatophilus congolensis]|uniref:Uncharacterized protein n=1 Tax=Dermatophilus congolensis TaxID=1863 RepID=A0AA46BQ40_9MICO|nr:Uncharacterised protein [Dermatophilus congolensis]
MRGCRWSCSFQVDPFDVGVGDACAASADGSCEAEGKYERNEYGADSDSDAAAGLDSYFDGGVGAEPSSGCGL